jgi:hydroxymethylbilane synthase
MTYAPVRLGTRGSKLALAQTEKVKNALETLGFEVDICPIQTTGDRIKDKPLYDIGGKALFAKEIHTHLLNERIDIAVHSLKDLDAHQSNDFSFLAFMEREDISDMFLSQKYKNLKDMPKNAVIGTCSPRRQAFLLHHFPHLQMEPLRGNVPTRLEKLMKDDFDAIILAKAGLNRLNIQPTCYASSLSLSVMLPCGGQGALVLETLKKNISKFEIIKKLSHKNTEISCLVERAFLKGLNGNCHTAVGVLAQVITKEEKKMVIDFQAAYFAPTRLLEEKQQWPLDEAIHNAYVLGEKWSLI